jgi:CHASE3 domain sensor protein
LTESLEQRPTPFTRSWQNQPNTFSGAFKLFNQLWQAFKRRLLIGASVLLLAFNLGIVAFAGLELGVFQTSRATTEKLGYTTRSLLIGLLNAETGARGYLITGDEIYLGPYYIGVQSVNNQMRLLRLLPLDENQRAEAVELSSLTSKQLVELADRVDQQRVQGRDAAVLRFKAGTDKVGLDTLRSYVDRTMSDMAESMEMLQRISKNYSDIATYCILFAAFWIYIIIMLVSRQPHGGKP